MRNRDSWILPRQTVDTMMEKFGEDYNVYMRYAFLEIDAQELLDNSDRDYTQFAQYYEKSAAAVQ